MLILCLGSGTGIWDDFSRCHPKNISDRSNADETCESYYRFEEDVFMVKSINVSLHYSSQNSTVDKTWLLGIRFLT